MRKPWMLIFSGGLVVLLNGCDRPLGDAATDPTAPDTEVTYSPIIPPGGEDPEHWSLEQWELLWLTLPFEIVSADIQGSSWIANGTPSFSLFTQLTTPLTPFIVPQISHLYHAQMIEDGAFSSISGGDQSFHTQFDGIRIYNFQLPSPNCSSIEDSGSWTINSSHLGKWSHFSFPLSRTSSPVNANHQGQCEVWEEPPPPGGGGGGESDCVTYLVTIYEWSGSYWEVVDQFLTDICF